MPKYTVTVARFVKEMVWYDEETYVEVEAADIEEAKRKAVEVVGSEEFPEDRDWERDDEYREDTETGELRVVRAREAK